jgi:hypothetical protein
MQKVVGSSPIIRSKIPANRRCAIVNLANDGCSVAALVLGQSWIRAGDFDLTRGRSHGAGAERARSLPANRGFSSSSGICGGRASISTCSRFCRTHSFMQKVILRIASSVGPADTIRDLRRDRPARRNRLQPATTRNHRARAGISSIGEPAVTGYDRLPPGMACVVRV